MKLKNKNDSKIWLGFLLSLSVLLGSLMFCSILLVVACMISTDSDYSRESMIIHNALQVHFAIAIQRLGLYVLLYVDQFHINISLNNGKIHVFTIGAYFCESLVRENKEYYHRKKSLFNNAIILDYVVTMQYAYERGWEQNQFVTSNPMDKDAFEQRKFANRLTLTTKLLDESTLHNGLNNDITTNRITIVTKITEPLVRIEDSNSDNVSNTDL